MKFITKHRNSKNCLVIDEFDIKSVRQLNVTNPVLQLMTSEDKKLFIFCRDEATLENLAERFADTPSVTFDDLHRESQIQEWLYIPNNEGLLICCQNNADSYVNCHTYQKKQQTSKRTDIFSIEYNDLLHLREYCEKYVKDATVKIQQFENKRALYARSMVRRNRLDRFDSSFGSDDYYPSVEEREKQLYKGLTHRENEEYERLVSMLHGKNETIVPREFIAEREMN